MGSQPFSANLNALGDRTYWLRVLRDARRDALVHGERPGGTLLSASGGGLVFVFGIFWHQHAWAVYTIAGTVTASFGAFQKLGESRAKSIGLMLIGLAIFTWLGSVVGTLGWADSVILATTCGFAFGAVTMLGYSGWWTGLQWMIGLIVLGAHPTGMVQASERALAVLCGGVSQSIFLAVIHPWTDHWFRPQDQPPLNSDGSIRETLLRHANPLDPAGRYAVRVASAMGICTLIAHFWDLPNGYWAPMTAAILLKPDFHEATLRGVNRLAGTLAGAGLTTLAISLLRPGHTLLGLLLLVAVGSCFALQRVNYALFVACITSYVVLLLSTLGLPEPVVALHRLLATLAGATVALLVSLIPLEGQNADTPQRPEKSDDQRAGAARLTRV